VDEASPALIDGDAHGWPCFGGLNASRAGWGAAEGGAGSRSSLVDGNAVGAVSGRRWLTVDHGVCTCSGAGTLALVWAAMGKGTSGTVLAILSCVGTEAAWMGMGAATGIGAALGDCSFRFCESRTAAPIVSRDLAWPALSRAFAVGVSAKGRGAGISKCARACRVFVWFGTKMVLGGEAFVTVPGLVSTVAATARAGSREEAAGVPAGGLTLVC